MYDKIKFVNWVYHDSTEMDFLTNNASIAFGNWSIHDVNMTGLQEVVSVLDSIITLVENYSEEENLSSRDKLGLTIDFLRNDILKTKVVPEVEDDLVLRNIISTLVSFKNIWWGKDWNGTEE